MSILASLVRAYDRLPDAPPFGYSTENIGLVIGLNADGGVANVTDLRITDGKRMRPRRVIVPRPIKRTSGIAANFLWDKTSYVLGVSARAGERVADEHAAFVALHEDLLKGKNDAGLNALLSFLRHWSPDRFVENGWPEELIDHNVVFALENERLEGVYLHDRRAAVTLWQNALAQSGAAPKRCLVTGENAPVVRLHPAIKGVWGAQSSGADIVSFNLDAFTSYGHEQGDNAPVSEKAVFAYTTVLNRFLERGSRNRIQIGDASTIFWADTVDSAVAEWTETMFAQFIDSQDDTDAMETAEEDKNVAASIRVQLERIRAGDQVEHIEPRLAENVRFCVLGLSPNAARISVRFYFEDDFGVLAENYRCYVSDMRIEPAPRRPYPPLWRYLLELAVQGKSENIPPNLAGAWMRAILTGQAYPRALLTSALGRIRTDGRINALRAAVLKAVLVRNYEMEVPVALDPEVTNKGYLLGRLFAIYERIQWVAMDGNINATIRDKFYGSASAAPRRVFAALDRNAANHLSKIGKRKRGSEGYLTKRLAGVMSLMSPKDDPFPASLSTQEQALFGLGYFHQREDLINGGKNSDAAKTATNEEQT